MYYVGPQGDEDDLVVVLDPKNTVNQQIIPSRSRAYPTTLTKLSTLSIRPDNSETHQQLVLISF